MVRATKALSVMWRSYKVISPTVMSEFVTKNGLKESWSVRDNHINSGEHFRRKRVHGE